MCLASMTPPRVDPITDANATAQGLRDTAALCGEEQAALAARLLVAAEVIDGLLDALAHAETQK